MSAVSFTDAVKSARWHLCLTRVVRAPEYLCPDVIVDTGDGYVVYSDSDWAPPAERPMLSWAPPAGHPVAAVFHDGHVHVYQAARPLGGRDTVEQALRSSGAVLDPDAHGDG